MSRFPVGLSVLFLAACSTPEPSVAPSPAPAAEPVAEQAPTTPIVAGENTIKAAPVQLAPGEVRVELVSAGDGSTRALRYGPAVGDAEPFELLIDLVVGMDMGGKTSKVTNIPPIRMQLDATLAETVGEDFRYDLTLKHTAVEPVPVDGELSAEALTAKKALDDETAAEAARYQGTTGQLVVSPMGIVSRTELTPPNGAVPFANLEKALSHAVVVLPEQPVGVGGSWTVTRQVKESGLTLQETKTYTVESLEGSQVVLTMEAVQRGDQASFAMQGLPEGTTANLVALVSEARGKVTLDLAHVFPTSSTVKQDFEGRVAVEQGGQGMLVGMTTDMDLTVERR